MTGRPIKPSPSMVIALLALFVSIGGVGYAASKIDTDQIKSQAVTTEKLAKNAVTSQKLAKLAVKTGKLADGSVTGQKVQADSLTGDNIDESTLGQVPDAAGLDGKGSGAFVASNIYKAESAVSAGTNLGDGTQFIDKSCDPGDILLSGGPANINATTDLLESFPSPGTTTSWRARVNKNGAADNFSVVVLCARQ